MSTFVLVPGYWLGAWAWEGVTGPLRAAGHTVHPITPTGLADRVHLGGPGTGLDTHIDDIAGTLVQEDLRDVVLVAHSGAGAAVTGAAGRVPERISKIVYLESGPIGEGTSTLDLYPPEGRGFVEAHLTGGWRYEPPSWEEQEMLGASTEGLDEADKARVAARMTPQPYGTLTGRLPAGTEAGTAKLPKALISCSFPLDEVRGLIEQGHPMFAPLSGPEWEFHELPTGHWPMFSRPADLARLLGTL
ncbi:alpha/beta fold hydrolase [Sphaerisporangium perillae]|uniref:alpha/beta fold hydrolase n=1 Tax=Sphaerisporangium perillae TaxID=2935860 RepID=UPI002010ABC3|nr:alpha/beta hydrolase [Sphaerisporangium perillae]